MGDKNTKIVRKCYPNVDRNEFDLQVRSRISLFFCLTALCVLATRLWYLQIIQGEIYRQRADSNRQRTLNVPAPRGLVFDRLGRTLVKNRPSFNIEFVQEDAVEPTKTLKELAKILQVNESEIWEKIELSKKKKRRFEPQLIFRDIDRDTLAIIEANRYRIPGIEISAVPARDYIYGEFAAHVLGYLGEVSPKQLEKFEPTKFRRGDIIGQSGIEHIQESVLRGTNGVKGVIVNATGAKIEESYYYRETPGKTLKLTLDAYVQFAAEYALEGKRGAIIAMDPKTGEVLAMVSRPGFDPSVFVNGLSQTEYKDLFLSKDNKIGNRAIQGVYPMGSVFKFIVAVAALSEKVIGFSDFIYCPGSYRVGKSRSFSCHKSSGHGPMNLKEALKKSCNVFFYTIGQKLGIDVIHKYADLFGLGQKVKFGLGDEPSGLVPSTAWKKTLSKDPSEQKWYPGETPSVSIGQGALAVTPLQIARAISALVNGGVLITPHIIKNSLPLNFKNLQLDKKVLNTVKEGLVAVVNEEGGTGSKAKIREDLNVLVGGKTGTAQTRALIGNKELAEKNSLAWFAGFAPAENPEIVVVALVEEGGHGGVSAAPVASVVLTAFFDQKNLPDLKPEKFHEYRIAKETELAERAKLAKGSNNKPQNVG